MSKAETTTTTTSTNQDFVIREGFPSLRKADGQPWLQGDEPLPTAPVCIFSKALTTGGCDADDAPWPASLFQDCRTVFSARTRDDDQAYSAGITYFLPAVMQPRCALEAVVQAIFKAHTACLPEGAMVVEQSGAEWWTLVLDDENNTTKQKGETKNSKDHTEAAKGVAAAVAQEDDQEEEEEEESDEVGLHFDADYGLEDQVTNLFLHPRVGTVTYLTDHGAPTVVLERRSPQQGKIELLNGAIKTGWLCHPVRGRHLAFDGRLLHGAPATFFPAHDDGGATMKQESSGGNDDDDDDQDTKLPPAKKAKVDNDQETATVKRPANQRITLLVNVWVNHCPMDADPLDDEICEQLTTPLDALQFASTLPDISMPPEKKVRLQLSSNDPAGEEEVVIGNRIVTAHYGPTMEQLHSASAMASTVEMEFEKNALCLVVGGLAPQEEEDDNDEN